MLNDDNTEFLLLGTRQQSIAKVDISAFISHFSRWLLYGLPASQLNKFQRVLNTTARLVCCATRFSHIIRLMYELHWLPLKRRIHFKILLFAFKTIHGIATTYIQKLVSLKSQGAYNLRSSGGILLALPTFRTKITLGDRSFQVAAPKLWNALQRELREIPDLHTFKSHLKTHLLKFAYSLNC